MNAPLLPFDAAGGTPWERRAIAFDVANPHVCFELVKLARKARRHGLRRVSIKLLFEQLRWEHALKTKGDRFKLNNAFSSWYARAIERRYPELRGMFEKRKTASESYRRPEHVS